MASIVREVDTAAVAQGQRFVAQRHAVPFDTNLFGAFVRARCMATTAMVRIVPELDALAVADRFAFRTAQGLDRLIRLAFRQTRLGVQVAGVALDAARSVITRKPGKIPADVTGASPHQEQRHGHEQAAKPARRGGVPRTRRIG